VLNVLYDLTERPITYDFVFAAVQGAMKAGGRPWRMIILDDRFRRGTAKDRALTVEQSRRRIDRIIYPTCRQVPGCRSVTVVTDWVDADRWRARATFRPSAIIADIAAARTAIPRLRAPEGHGIGDVSGAVVITLRNTDKVNTKNCNMPAWLQAASEIEATGRRVILIPDTDMALSGESLPGDHEWWPVAAVDLTTRVALYEQAGLCLSMGVGPAAFQMFSNAPFGIFLRHRAIEPKPDLHLSLWGVEWGEQLPWTGGRQEIIYETDDYRNIMAAYERLG